MSVSQYGAYSNFFALFTSMTALQWLEQKFMKYLDN